MRAHAEQGNRILGSGGFIVSATRARGVPVFEVDNMDNPITIVGDGDIDAMKTRKNGRRPAALTPETQAALASLGATIAALPPERRAELERDVRRVSYRAANPDRKRGRPTLTGKTLSVPMLVKVTPEMRKSMERAAVKYGATSVPDYLRRLHEAYLAADGGKAKP